jgi:hypothetical protein
VTVEGTGDVSVVMQRGTGIFVLAVAACLVGGGGSGRGASVTLQASGTSAQSVLLPVPRSPGCPLHAPPPVSLDVATPTVARRGATSLELCRYSGGNAPRPLRLTRSRFIRDLVLIRSLTRRLNTLPQRRGVFHCPLDDGSEVLMLFGHPRHSAQRIIVGLTGCRFVTNGRTSRLGPSAGSARLVRELIALTGG